jgi:branched-chain amino acid transport system permease protein
MGGQLAINAVLAAAHFGLIALSFAIVSRTARFFHVGHGAIYTLAAYVAFSVSAAGGSIILAAVAGVGGAALVGCIMEVLVFRGLRRRSASPEILLLSSFGLLIVAQSAVSILWGDARRILWHRPATPGLEVLGGHVTPSQLIAVGLSVVVAVGMVAWSRFTFAGLVLRAVGDDPELSRMRGIRSETGILASFAIASAVMGLAGVLQAVDTGLTPLMGFRALLVGFAGALLGGLDSDIRAYLGGVAIGILEQMAARYLPGQWYESVILAILVLVLIARGSDLLPQREQ